MSGPIPTASASDGTKLCPFCAESIKSAAIKCKHCGADLAVRHPDDARKSGPRSGIRVIGLVLFAIVCGFLSYATVSYINRDPEEVRSANGIRDCRAVQNDELQGLDDRRLARSMCDLLERKHLERFRRSP